MTNAHLRFGWLTYVKSTEKTTASIKVRFLAVRGATPTSRMKIRAALGRVLG